MNDTEPQTAAGKVLWHFTMSLDGFVAGPNHEMDWMSGSSSRPGLEDEYVATTGAVLGGRDVGVTFLDCDPAEAVRIGLEAAGGKNLEALSPTIGRPVRLHRVGDGDPTAAVNMRYQPTTTAAVGTP